VLNINCDIEINYYTTTSNYVKLYTCDTKWARVGKYIFYVSGTTGVGIEIKEVVENQYIGFYYNSQEEISRVFLSNPFFISGTKTSTNNEWTKVGNSLILKTPLIWLYQNYTERIYGLDNSLERSITMNLAFLDETNPKFITNKEHIDNAVKPCSKLKDEFIKSINKNVIYKTLKSFDTKTFSRFGVETDGGIVQNILDADLSGVVLNITLDKFKEPCKC
jgi:hypothetical protein